MEGQRRWQGRQQSTPTGDGRPQWHRAPEWLHRQDYERRARRGDGGQHGPGEHDDRQSEEHGDRHGQRARESESADRQDQSQGKWECAIITTRYPCCTSQFCRATWHGSKKYSCPATASSPLITAK